MNGQQYEELCRRYVADAFGVDLNSIQTDRLPNPRRPGLPHYEHQIDLSWETGTPAARYFHIANAKWRASDKVDQGEVLLLQQVKEKVAAHKAVMLTSVGFTRGAIAVASDNGIALHVVGPADFVPTALPSKGRNAIRDKLETLASSESRPLYRHEVIHRAWSPQRVSGQAAPARAAPGAPGYQTRVTTGYETKTVTAPARRVSRAGEKRAGPGFSKK